MLLSVIIPAHNAGGYLGDALESVLGQEGKEYEILVVNDGSSDDTANIARDYGQRFSNIHLISSKHLGVSHARNLGLEAAKGKYIAFLDADDVLCSGAYTPDLEATLREEEYDVISFGCLHAEQHLLWGSCVPEGDGTADDSDPKFRTMITRKSFCSYLYRREMLGDLRFPVGVRYSEDAVFAYLASCRAKNMRLMPRYWFIYRNYVFSAMHRNADCGYFLTDIIPAWFRAAYDGPDSQSCWDCLGMVYEHTANYLRRGAMCGVSLSNLVYALSNSKEIDTVLNNPGMYWTTRKSNRIIRNFQTKPKQTWLKYRISGVFVERIRKLLRTNNTMRYIYLRMRYRQDLSPWR